MSGASTPIFHVSALPLADGEATDAEVDEDDVFDPHAAAEADTTAHSESVTRTLYGLFMRCTFPMPSRSGSGREHRLTLLYQRSLFPIWRGLLQVT